MKIFKCLISGDELCSDSYPLKLVDEVVYEVEGKMISISNAISDAAIGGNKSENPEEEAEDGCADAEEKKINIVHSHRLVEVPYDKATFQQWLKSYMKDLAERLEKSNPERVPIFKQQAAKYVKEKIFGCKFSDWQFFTGESMRPDGMVLLLNYREDGVTPYFVLFKDGLLEQKY